MHNGELAKKEPRFTCISTKRMSSKTKWYVPVKKTFRTWMKALLCCWFG